MRGLKRVSDEECERRRNDGGNDVRVLLFNDGASMVCLPYAYVVHVTAKSQSLLSRVTRGQAYV